MESDDRSERARRRGRALGALFGDLTGGASSTYAAWEAGRERKRRRQADARRRAGLPPALFIESGCESDPGR